MSVISSNSYYPIPYDQKQSSGGQVFGIQKVTALLTDYLQFEETALLERTCRLFRSQMVDHLHDYYPEQIIYMKVTVLRIAETESSPEYKLRDEKVKKGEEKLKKVQLEASSQFLQRLESSSTLGLLGSVAQRIGGFFSGANRQATPASQASQLISREEVSSLKRNVKFDMPRHRDDLTWWAKYCLKHASYTDSTHVIMKLFNGWKNFERLPKIILKEKLDDLHLCERSLPIFAREAIKAVGGKPGIYQTEQYGSIAFVVYASEDKIECYLQSKEDINGVYRDWQISNIRDRLMLLGNLVSRTEGEETYNNKLYLRLYKLFKYGKAPKYTVKAQCLGDVKELDEIEVPKLKDQLNEIKQKKAKPQSIQPRQFEQSFSSSVSQPATKAQHVSSLVKFWEKK